MIRFFKRFFTFFALILFILQIPVLVNAESEDILQAHEQYLLNNNILVSGLIEDPIQITPRWTIQQHVIGPITFKNSIIVEHYTRVDDNSPINLSLMVTSSRSYVDAAIFNAKDDTIMGITRHLTSNQFNSVNWSAEELAKHGNNTRNIYLFLTVYTDASATVYGAITL